MDRANLRGITSGGDDGPDTGSIELVDEADSDTRVMNRPYLLD